MVARAYVTQIDAAHPFSHAIMTQVVPDHGFYPAEGNHQNFLNQHRDNGYIATFDRPKLDALKLHFPEL